jgi:RNA polymerase sigma factor (sigma-70 family)
LGATDPRDAEVLLRDTSDGRPNPEEELEKKSLAELVWRLAESNLPSRRFCALRLRKKGLTDEQIGQQLGISKEAAKQLVHNAIKELNEMLKIMGVL